MHFQQKLRLHFVDFFGGTAGVFGEDKRKVLKSQDFSTSACQKTFLAEGFGGRGFRQSAFLLYVCTCSHDVKTPLASLVGYLEAVESKMVTGAEQEEYIRVAAEKAHHLKEFVTALFEWVKLDAGEQIFHFELCDLNELSRNIMADWVPLLESHDLIIPVTKAQLYFSKVAVVILMSVGLCLITFLMCVVGGLIAGGFPDLSAQALIDAGLLYLTGGLLIPIAMLPIVFLATLSKGYMHSAALGGHRCGHQRPPCGAAATRN